LVRVCQTNTRLHKLCHHNKILSHRINHYLLKIEKDYIKMKYKIARTILSEENKKGSTLVYIKKYLECNYNIDPKTPLIKNTIHMLTQLKSGERLIINPKHKGHYKLSKELKDAVQSSL
jgi:hypothetical protein